MTIHAGTSARYYRCSDEKKRGTCANKLSLREDVAKQRLLDALHARYAAPSAVSYLRKKIAEHLGALGRQTNTEVTERVGRLKRTEDRIAGLVRFISEGDHSDSVRSALLDLEAQAKSEKSAIEGLRQRASQPVTLPTPEAVAASTADLRQAMDADPLRAREHLRRLFEGGRLMLKPQEGGFYVAEGRIDVFAFLTLRFEATASGPQTSKTRTTLAGNSGPMNGPNHDVWSSHGCAGRI